MNGNYELTDEELQSRPDDKKPPDKYTYLVWFISALIITVGIYHIFSGNAVGGVLVMFSSILALPPASKLLHGVLKLR